MCEHVLKLRPFLGDHQGDDSDSFSSDDSFDIRGNYRFVCGCMYDRGWRCYVVQDFNDMVLMQRVSMGAIDEGRTLPFD